MTALASIPNPEEIEELIAQNQARMKGYALSLTGDRHAAEDILQESNLVIWRKASTFEKGTNFLSWAFRIIHFQTLAFRRKADRDRLVFDDDLIDTMASETVEEDPLAGR